MGVELHMDPGKFEAHEVRGQHAFVCGQMLDPRGREDMPSWMETFQLMRIVDPGFRNALEAGKADFLSSSRN